MTDLELVIKSFTDSVLPTAGTFVVDVEVKGVSGSKIVWIYLDTVDGGVSVEDCATVSNQLGILLEANELFSGKYVLNVSSPGLDRPLKDLRQYPKNVGRKVKLRYLSEDGGKNVIGKLTAFDGESIQIETEKGEQLTVSLEKALETKILPVW
ncbi:MAG: ribosome maturation factor RimP [Bacteroidetes bacterium]|nr:ribosome maturation factor RimP [Bacteroidota bacterium]